MIFEDEMCSFTTDGDSESDIESKTSEIDDQEDIDDPDDDDDHASSQTVTISSSITLKQRCKQKKEPFVKALLRQKGITILSSILTSEKNVSIFENNIFNKSNNKSSIYKNLLYEVCSMLHKIGRQKVSIVLLLLKNDKLLWNSDSFKSVHNKLQEQDDFLQHPLEVEEGIFTCRCGSKRTISFSIQTRSGDEATSVFVTCIACNNKWKAN
jgi:DNA-directed RNA polymerase subunit M/transcription elongation factor TFIIS